MGGVCVGKSHSVLAEAMRVRASPAASQQDVAPDFADVPLETLGVHVPVLPGDVGLCGDLSATDVACLAGRYKAWLYVNTPDSPNFHRAELERAGIVIDVKMFPGPPTMPSEAQAAAVLDALDSLPRPLMMQCTSGMRVGAALLLWLAKRRGYSAMSAEQLATDISLKFYVDCVRCGPMREWLKTQLPAQDTLCAQTHADDLIFKQLYDPETSTFTYVLGCGATNEAVLIDPVLEHKDRDLRTINELGLQLRYVVNTHCHADHITSGGAIRKELPEVRTVIAEASGAKADVHVRDGDQVKFGKLALEAIATPGHTDGCITWLLQGAPSRVFTGDTLLIRGCGRTDFQLGNAGSLYDNVHSKIFTLPGETLVYPGHDYKGRNVSTVDEEKRFNTRLSESREGFIKFMSELNLPYPKKIDAAVPANMVCGTQD